MYKWCGLKFWALKDLEEGKESTEQIYWQEYAQKIQHHNQWILIQEIIGDNSQWRGFVTASIAVRHLYDCQSTRISSFHKTQQFQHMKQTVHFLVADLWSDFLADELCQFLCRELDWHQCRWTGWQSQQVKYVTAGPEDKPNNCHKQPNSTKTQTSYNIW